MEKLHFSEGNAKLSKGDTLVFSLPAGHTCPGAKSCRSMVHPEGGHIIEGPDTVFRCFGATEECRLANVRKSRWRNYKLLAEAGTREAMSGLVHRGIASYSGVSYVRVHASGDFFSEAYFLAWMDAARELPDTTFYGYTKSVHLWIPNMAEVPGNFVLTASYGGRHDHLIEEHGLKSAKVVFHPEDAGGLPIDHDDSHARIPDIPFALLLHSVQPAGSEASGALKRMRSEGVEFGYKGKK
jgi:hypothetical protein